MGRFLSFDLNLLERISLRAHFLSDKVIFATLRVNHVGMVHGLVTFLLKNNLDVFLCHKQNFLLHLNQ